jgi:amino acid transporter
VWTALIAIAIAILTAPHSKFVPLVPTLSLALGALLHKLGHSEASWPYVLIVFSAAGVVLAVAEIAAVVPLSGSIVRYAEVFVDPFLPFANGWNLVYKGPILIPIEIDAAAVLISAWAKANNIVLSIPLILEGKTIS